MKLTGFRAAAALAVAGFLAAGCGGETAQAGSGVAARSADTDAASQTTAATLPVVTVYKSPT